MKEKGVCGYDFEMPNFIRGFKEPDALSLKDDDYWVNEIQKLMKSVQIPKEQWKIKVWGYGQKYDKNYEYQSLMRVDMHAQIIGFDTELLQNFKDKYNKRSGVLGTAKLHINLEFEQIAAVTTSKIFDALYDEYTYILLRIRS